MNETLISSPAGVMSVLVAVVALWFWLERRFRWKIFEYLPPLIFIYATPVVLSNTGVIPYSSETYDFLREYGLPVFIVAITGVFIPMVFPLLARRVRHASGKTAHWAENDGSDDIRPNRTGIGSLRTHRSEIWTRSKTDYRAESRHVR